MQPCKPPARLRVAARMGTGLCANQNMPSSTLCLKIVMAQEQAWWAEKKIVLSATFPVLKKEHVVMHTFIIISFL